MGHSAVGFSDVALQVNFWSCDSMLILIDLLHCIARATYSCLVRLCFFFWYGTKSIFVPFELLVLSPAGALWRRSIQPD